MTVMVNARIRTRLGAPVCCGRGGSAFPQSSFETLLKAACSDAQSPSLYLERALQWL